VEKQNRVQKIDKKDFPYIKEYFKEKNS